MILRPMKGLFGHILRWDSLNPGQRAAKISALCTACILPVGLYVVAVTPVPGKIPADAFSEVGAIVTILVSAVALVFGLRGLFLVRTYGWRGILVTASLTSLITGYFLYHVFGLIFL